MTVRRIRQTATGWTITGAVPDPTLPPVLWCHGDPGGSTQASTLDTQVRRMDGITGSIIHHVLDGLLATGHTVHVPWFSACWGTDIDPYTVGGHGYSVIDQVVPDGPVHVAGVSMGGFHAPLWASHHPDRIASLTMISPAVDVLACWDAVYSLSPTSSVCIEMATTIGGDPDGDRDAVAAGLVTIGADIPTMAAALAPLAGRCMIVTGAGDPVIPAAAVTAFADEAGITDLRVIPVGGHPVGYKPLLGWDPDTILRHAHRWE